MIPWHLYQLTARDQGSPNIRPWHVYNNTSFVGVVAGTHVFTVPDDTYAMISYISVATENGSSPCNFVRFAIQDLAGNIQAHGVEFKQILSADNDWSMRVSGQPLFMIPPRWTITTYFGSLVGNHELHSSVSGILIPRGTLALS